MGPNLYSVNPISCEGRFTDLVRYKLRQMLIKYINNTIFLPDAAIFGADHWFSDQVPRLRLLLFEPFFLVFGKMIAIPIFTIFIDH